MHSGTANQLNSIPAEIASGEQAGPPPDGRSSHSLGAGYAWGLILLVAFVRVISFIFLKADSAYTLVPRSFIGGGFESMPALLDVVVPAIVILALFSRRRFFVKAARWWLEGGADAASLLLFPLAAGLSMLAYEGRWQILSNLTLASMLRWLQFAAAYLAWNLLLDNLHSRWQRIVAVPILAASLGFLEDVYPGTANPINIALSMGLMLTWTVLALRRRYRESPRRATLAAAIFGGVGCLVIVMAPSNSLFIFLLSFLALPVGALAMRSQRWWPQWAALAGIAGIGLVLSFLVPRFIPPGQRAAFLTQEPHPAHAEQADGIAVSFDDVRVREIALQMAHVLAAANQVSREAYGISPQVDKLVIRGFEEGGFQAQFPHRIDGNFVSPQQVNLSLNSSFLNGDPSTSIDFPDPVNAILHEYSHLYGTVPYQPWIMGAEEEGWATFSATRLSHRLYERFGPGLWSPAYNYASRADAITRSTLAGHSVYWSHPNEYGGFRLWHSLSAALGEANLYRTRWALTRRDGRGWWLQVNDPGAARRMAQRFGDETFTSLGAGTTTYYREIYTLQEVQTAVTLLTGNASQAPAEYEGNAGEIIDPTVRVPSRWPTTLDIVLSTLLTVLAFFVAIIGDRQKQAHNRQIVN
jgi:hypothetical protein